MNTNEEDLFVSIRVHSWLRTRTDPGAALVKRGSESTAPEDTDTELQNREWTLMNTNEEDLFVSIIRG